MYRCALYTDYKNERFNIKRIKDEHNNYGYKFKKHAIYTKK